VGVGQPQQWTKNLIQTNRQNKALDAEPPRASFVKSLLIGGGPVNAVDYEVQGWQVTVATVF
jgi:hypothetical protein